MNVLDLFSGIGGFSLGLERAGMRTVAFCEIEPHQRAVLRKHWPGVPIAKDITERQFSLGEAEIICGGFPCQDISDAGLRAGITGTRSGLWRELVRAVRVVRPQYVILENVAAILGRGLGVVLGDLAESGYDAEWDCISAQAVGSPQQRDRWWAVAYPKGREARCTVLHHRCGQAGAGRPHEASQVRGCGCLRGAGEWDSEPSLGRVVDGVSPWVDELAALGNSVVPQIPEIIGRAIMQAEGLAA